MFPLVLPTPLSKKWGAKLAWTRKKKGKIPQTPRESFAPAWHWSDPTSAKKSALSLQLLPHGGSPYPRNSNGLRLCSSFSKTQRYPGV